MASCDDKCVASLNCEIITSSDTLENVLQTLECEIKENSELCGLRQLLAASSCKSRKALDKMDELIYLSGDDVLQLRLDRLLDLEHKLQKLAVRDSYCHITNRLTGRGAGGKGRIQNRRLLTG